MIRGHNLFNLCRSHDQDGHHAHIWINPFKRFLLWNQMAKIGGRPEGVCGVARTPLLGQIISFSWGFREKFSTFIKSIPPLQIRTLLSKILDLIPETGDPWTTIMFFFLQKCQSCWQERKSLEIILA